LGGLKAKSAREENFKPVDGNENLSEM